MIFALNSSHFVFDYFLVEQSVFEFIKLSRNIHSFCRIRVFTNSPITFPSGSSFILPITFLLVGSKNFKSSG